MKLDLVPVAVGTEGVERTVPIINRNSRLEPRADIRNRLNIDNALEASSTVAVEFASQIGADMDKATTIETEICNQADRIAHLVNAYRWIGIEAKMTAGQSRQMAFDRPFHALFPFGPQTIDHTRLAMR